MKSSKTLRDAALGTSLFTATVTMLSFVRHPHWIFRSWDFPRLQIAALGILGASTLAAVTRGKRKTAMERTAIASAAAAVAWQIYRIHPYTPLKRKVVEDADASRDDDKSISLMMTNVLMENDRHEMLLSTIERHDPDIVLAVEVDDAWIRGLQPLASRYPYRVECPQDNYYGMVIFSKLELIEPEIRFLVQHDIPSIHTRVRLRSGDEILLHGLHPRPPEPIRDQPSTPRDAELVLVGRAIENEEDLPTIVAGDLNDVAWSSTSQLFVRLSGMLDPRIGRGFFNSYNANNPLFRYPLDHVFHSNHFKLISLKRLEKIGSDHFPLLIHLHYDPEAPAQQEPTHKKPGDEKRASERIEKEREDAATGKDRPNDD